MFQVIKQQSQMNPYVLSLGATFLFLLVSCGKKTASSEAQDSDQSTAEVATISSEKPLSYNEHIRPILSDKCFLCHGPDLKNNKADLRLDTAEAAYALLKGGSGHGIVPKDLENSEVWRRITSDDPDEIMPTPSSNLKLSEEEKEKIKIWIEQGAEYEEHWAFVPVPDAVEVPELNSEWTRGPVDQFVLSKLQENDRKPNAEASAERWLKRVSYDLNGLPPTPEEREAFLAAVATQGDQAYANKVDELLSNERYGESIATMWLDIARYADSYGYQDDYVRKVWPYRDWVIKSFNENLPYDQFITQQLAGDLLPDSGRNEKLATTFNRLHRMTNEGGSINEEFLTEYAADRVHTFGTAFLALTLECCRCHDHKYDPVSQKEYFQFYAFFNSIDERGMYPHFTKEATPTPHMDLPTPEEEVQIAGLKKQRAASQESLMSYELDQSSFEKWLSASSELSLPTPRLVASLEGETKEDIYDVQGLEKKKVEIVDGVPEKTAGRKGEAYLFEGDSRVVMHDDYDQTRSTPLTASLWMKTAADPKALQFAALIHRTQAGDDAGFQGWQLHIEDRKLTSTIAHFWPGNAMKIESAPVLEPDRWYHLALSYDGLSKAAGLKIYLDGELLPTSVVRDNLTREINELKQGLTIGGRLREVGFKGGIIDEVQTFNLELLAPEIRALAKESTILTAPSTWSEQEQQLYYKHRVDGQWKELQEGLLTSHTAVNDAIDETLNIVVMEELAEPIPAYLLDRGEYDSPKTEENRVYRETPQVLPAYPEEASRDRLGLAEWLVDTKHPLTSRVAVNRFWQHCFGKGIVGSSDNFGMQGNLPTHPQLLDYLSREFMESGWDVKALLKTIVLSSTYRQDSRVPVEERLNDPDNMLLARGPSKRLSAEMIRDLALVSSGLLKEKVGGAPTSPYQPKNFWSDTNDRTSKYVPSKGDELFRRSIYTIWKRTSPMPNLTAFDATSREVCMVERSSTNTPLQALVLLNDPQFVEASRVLASRAMLETESDSEFVQRVYELACATGISTEEKELLLLLLDEQREEFKDDLEGAQSLISIGESPLEGSLEPIELAARTIVAQAVLNSDSAIWKR